MLYKKFCLCLLMVSMVTSAIPIDFMSKSWEYLIYSAGTEAVYEGTKQGVALVIGVLIYLGGRKMIFHTPDNGKHKRLVAIQQGRIMTSNHLAQFIEKIKEKREKHSLTEQEEKQLTADITQRETIEAAIRKSAHQFEKPSKELQTTGWIFKFLRPVAEGLPG